MTISQMVEEIDSTIARLQEAKALLLSSPLLNQLPAVAIPQRKPLSAEGRRKIVEAQKARWVKLNAAMKSDT
jgi:hypothetical protein